MSKHQSGFYVLHTALLEVTYSWACNIDIGNVNAVAFLDLKKAFDTVDQILLSKLHLSGVTHKCFFSLFYIIILRHVLSMVPFQKVAPRLKSGIPQGTILGRSTVFDIYIYQ